MRVRCCMRPSGVVCLLSLSAGRRLLGTREGGEAAIDTTARGKGGRTHEWPRQGDAHPEEPSPASEQRQRAAGSAAEDGERRRRRVRPRS